jgi:hypothetical protein
VSLDSTQVEELMARHVIVLVFVASSLALFADRAAAQSPDGPGPARSLHDLRSRVSADDVVAVVDVVGHRTRGRISAFSDTALMLAIDGSTRRFSVDQIARIERRRRDPVANGLLMGAATGAVLGYGVGRHTDSPTCPRPGIECGQGATLGTVTGALWGAAGGWLADTLIRKREVLFVRP